MGVSLKWPQGVNLSGFYNKDTGTVAYKVTGNYLVISEDNTLDTAIIQTITSTQLKLYEKELDTDSTSGIPYVIESWTMLSK